MTDILIKIHIAESKINIRNLPLDTSKKYFSVLQNRIFTSYKTDTGIFNKSYRYYLSHIEKMDKIYASVVDSLSLREGRKMVD